MSSIFNAADTNDFAKLCVLGGLSFFTWRNSEQSETTMILFQIKTDFSLFFSEKVRHDIQAPQKLFFISVML